MSSPHYWVIIPAAGTGARMGTETPKQYLKLHNKAVIEYSLNSFLSYKHPEFRKIVVALQQNDSYWPGLNLSHHTKIMAAIGGTERCLSVLNGLIALKNQAHDDDWVLVHDAARPCLHHSDIDKLIAHLKDHSVGGILATPLRDTIKQTHDNKHISCTLDRNTLWRAFTPQMFRYGLIRDALQSAMNKNQLVTDEASAIELLGEKPLLIEGRCDNIKITEPDDLKLAEFYLLNK